VGAGVVPLLGGTDGRVTAFRWVPDPESHERVLCPECGGETEPLRCEPDRSETYLTHIALCVTEGCRRAWPYLGARALRKAAT
jgi:hypothetical protein